jgi:NDP-sugar pyrophosphorylase family protein
MAVVESEKITSCGLVTLNGSQRIVRFEEKKQIREKGYVNTGIYFFKKDILSSIPANTKYSLEYDLFPKLSNQNSFAFVSCEKLIDIGTPERYKRARKYFTAYTKNLSVRDFNKNKIMI